MNKNLMIGGGALVIFIVGLIWYLNTYTPDNTAVTPPANSNNACLAGDPNCEDITGVTPPASPVPTPAPEPMTVVVPPPPDLTASVAIVSSSAGYSPATLTVKKGTTVTWTNNDTVRHNVMSDSGNVLSSPYLSKGESWSYTFNTPGTYPYHCTPHPWMKAKVIVTE